LVRAHSHTHTLTHTRSRTHTTHTHTHTHTHTRASTHTHPPDTQRCERSILVQNNLYRWRKLPRISESRGWKGKWESGEGESHQSEVKEKGWRTKLVMKESFAISTLEQSHSCSPPFPWLDPLSLRRLRLRRLRRRFYFGLTSRQVAERATKRTANTKNTTIKGHPQNQSILWNYLALP
jgi:hypothetical protein